MTKQRLKRAERLARNAHVMTELLCYDLINLPVRYVCRRIRTSAIA